MASIKKSTQRAGFTLVEALISISIFSLIVVIAAGGLAQALRAQRNAAALLAAQTNVTLAVEQMAREVRTGYLFCHDVGNNINPTSTCSCVVGDSGYSDPGAPGALANGDLPVWTCGALDFYNSQSAHVNYSLVNGALSKGTPGSPQPITGTNVTVHSLSFVLFGNTEGDNWTPRITVTVGLSASSSDAFVANNILTFQTTVSSRPIDCLVSASGTPAC